MSKFKTFKQVGWKGVTLARVPSWEWPGVRAKYGRIGAWSFPGGIAFRVRDFVLNISWRP